MADVASAPHKPPQVEAAHTPDSLPKSAATKLTMAETEPEVIDAPAKAPSFDGEVKSKQSLQHILTSESTLSSHPRRSQSQTSTTRSPQQETPPTQQPIIWVDGTGESTENDNSTQNDSYTRAAEFNPSHTMTVAHTRRNANGTIGSVYSGNKIRHLKKDDGVPLWRKDIQLEFLRYVFEDPTPCFTKAFDHTSGHTFADVYVDAMARSSKTSKVLKEKLLSDRSGAMSMAMVCLLVNVGRMNTTLNFFPEMRAQLRTYHPIPSLQAKQDPSSFKTLQDAPRLKSILKGASEDANQPTTIDKIKASPVPRTNPVHLIFVLSQYAPKISEIHFHTPRDFFDLVMRSTLSSKSRARAFLWLIWWYLESDFSAEAALKNPFGEGTEGDGTEGLPLKVPAFEHLTEEQAELENVDTEEEREFGETKRLERRRILEEDDMAGPPSKRVRKANGESVAPATSDAEQTRSPSPSLTIDQHNVATANTVNPPTTVALSEGSPATSRYQPLQSKAEVATTPQRLGLKMRFAEPARSSPPIQTGSGHPVLNNSSANGAYRRSRPETSHQKAVNINRKMRTDHILHKQMVSTQRHLRREKRRRISTFGILVMNRGLRSPELYDTEDERTSWGPKGLVPKPDEREDYGEEAIRHKKVLDRALRRLFRDECAGGQFLRGSSRGYQKRKRKSRAQDLDGEESSTRKRRRVDHMQGTPDRRNGVAEPRQEGLDDLDLDLLGESRDEDEEDSGLDGSEGEDRHPASDEFIYDGELFKLPRLSKVGLAV